MSDPKNAAQHKQLQGWGDLFKYAGHSGEMYIWAYSIQAKCGLVPMNNYGVYEDHYKFYADMGATAMLDHPPCPSAESSEDDLITSKPSITG